MDDAEVVERVRARLVSRGAAATPAAVAAALRSEFALSGAGQISGALGRLHDEFAGAGPLQPVLRDPEVTDVLVNAPDEVWVDRGHGLVPAPVRLGDEESVRRLAQRLAARCGRRLDAAAPYVDGRLPDGTRLHAVLPPVSPRGTLLSLRVPRRRAFTLDELVAAGTATQPLAQLLATLVRARLAFLVSGGTGSGKTTLLSALLGLVDPGERVLLVEDSGELLPSCPHVVRLEARTSNVEGAGEVSLRDLVRQGLRMRPDRIVVGEVRGAEVVDLLAALNTGHEGGCGTVHANSAADVPARLEALAAVGGLPAAALHSQAAAALDVIVHLRRDRAGARSITSVSIIERDPDLGLAARPAMLLADGVLRSGPAADRLRMLLADRGVAAADLRGLEGR